ncbi:hypothetical protein [Marinomonas atlantica]|uniref:hypothetical protein n=1 Tax=Marinomonas atlantica TaxID=1806668 RepID=UPI000836E6CA|nr:hypothetical protein [Marinomonas atlantica]
MSAYFLYGACLAAVWIASFKYAVALGRLKASKGEQKRLADLIERLKKNQSRVALRNIYRAQLSYYQRKAAGLNLQPAASKSINFTVLLSSSHEFPDREIKKLYGPDLIAGIPKAYRCNGVLLVENIQYLGQVNEVAGGEQ